MSLAGKIEFIRNEIKDLMREDVYVSVGISTGGFWVAQSSTKFGSPINALGHDAERALDNLYNIVKERMTQI